MVGLVGRGSETPESENKATDDPGDAVRNANSLPSRAQVAAAERRLCLNIQGHAQNRLGGSLRLGRPAVGDSRGRCCYHPAHREPRPTIYRFT